MKIAEQMIKQFEKAQTEITKIIIDKKNRGLVTGTYEEAQRRCSDIINQLLYIISDDVPKMVEEEMHGLKNSLQYQIANNLANNQVGDLVKAVLNSQNVVNYVIGRLADDKYRNLTLEQLATLNSGGFTVPMATKFLKEALEKENITCFVDKLGRNWGLNAYSKMAIRTGSRQNRNAGLLSADEHDLYYVVPIGSTCPICAVLEGRVYSKSGTNPHYPPLTELYGKIDPMGANDLSNSYLTIHPNCRHTLVKWTEATKTEEEIEEMREKSSFTKHPKDINPQSQKEIEEYRESQRSKARFRATLKAYKKKQDDGLFIPKSFQAYIDNKEKNTENYQEWEKGYSTKKVNAKTFIKALEEAKEQSDNGWRVSAKREKLYEGSKLYITNKGSTVGINKNREIIGLCKVNEDKATGRDLLNKAIRHGGDKVTSYSGNYNFYVRNGFKPISYCVDDSFDKYGEPLICFKKTNEEFERLSYTQFIEKTKISKDYKTAKEELNK